MNFTETEFLKVISFIGIPHLILVVLSVMELKIIPFYSLSIKRRWFIIICMLPLIGPLLFHLRARIGWGKIDL